MTGTGPGRVVSKRVKSRGVGGGKGTSARVRQSNVGHHAQSGVTHARSRVLRFGVASNHCETRKALVDNPRTEKAGKSQRLSETWLDFARIIVSAELTGKIRSEDSQR